MAFRATMATRARSPTPARAALASEGPLPPAEPGIVIRVPDSPAEELARDYLQLEDRLHPLEDREHEGVDDVPRDGELLGVAPAAVQELPLLRHPDRDVGSEELRHRRLE